jgi:hypothetical protein
MERAERANREKKAGMLLIAIGICIPLMMLPFLSSSSKEKGIVDYIYKAGIAIKKENPGGEESPSPINLDEPKAKANFSRLVPKRIPFRFFLAATLILLYMGVIRIDRSRRRLKGEFDEDLKNENVPPPVSPEY